MAMITCPECNGKGVTTCEGTSMTYGTSKHPDNCPACRGTNKIKCPRCNGKGKEKEY